jgi:hypothetical protein
MFEFQENPIPILKAFTFVWRHDLYVPGNALKWGEISEEVASIKCSMLMPDGFVCAPFLQRKLPPLSSLSHFSTPFGKHFSPFNFLFALKPNQLDPFQPPFMRSHVSGVHHKANNTLGIKLLL